MKKIIVLFITFLLCSLALLACKPGSRKEEKEYFIYYLNKEETEIVSMGYEGDIIGKKTEEMAFALLEELSVQPKEVGYHAPILEFTIKDCIVQEGQITLNMSKEYENLDFTKEILIRAAIVKTLSQLEGIQLILFQVEGKALTDSSGEEVGVMSLDTFLDNTGQEMKKYEETTLALYFANVTGNQLIKVNRTLHYNTNTSLEKLVVEQLVAGPLNVKNDGAEIYPVVNKETKIIGVSMKDGICYVNLSNSFLTTVNNVTPDIAVYSFVNSLTELAGVLKVQIAVEGETKLIFGEKYDLSSSFERNLNLVETTGEIK